MNDVLEPESQEEHMAAVTRDAERLAATLVAATDADVSPALILPELMRVFRASGLPMPGMG